MLKSIVEGYFHLGLRVFFREIEVEGRERVPLDGPLIVAPNHLNAFVDPVLIQAVMPRGLTITAKNTLAHKRLYGLLLRIGGVVTFHRRQDWGKGADMRANAEAMAECRRRLDRREALCIFPEGISHSDPAMRPFKMGTARIALEYAESDGALRILPVGQIYEAKEHFRSRVWIRFGEPIDVHAWIAAAPDGGRRELTAEMESRVRALTLNFASHRDAILADWAAQVLLAHRDGSDRLDAAEPPLSERSRLAQQLGETLATRPALARSVRSHRAALRRLDLVPGEAALCARAGRLAPFVLKELGLAIVGLPLALWGAANNLLAYLILRWITARMATGRDLWASSALYFSVAVFPVVSILQTALVWAAFSGIAAALYALLLLPAGYFSLVYGERFARSWRRIRTCVRLRREPALLARLQRDSHALSEELLGVSDNADALPMASQNRA